MTTSSCAFSLPPLPQEGIDNPVADLSLINSLTADLTFDQSWSVSDMVDLVLDFHSVDINAVPQLTLPVSVVSDPEGSGGQLLYEGAEYGDVEFTRGSTISPPSTSFSTSVRASTP